MTDPSYVTVMIKASKTDMFRKGVTVYGPFFPFSDGCPLMRDRLVRELKTALKKAGTEADNYTNHSFRISIATTAVAQSLPDSLIKTLGAGRVQPISYTSQPHMRGPTQFRITLMDGKISESGI